ncbi:4,5-DOPA dioxygenase extradiol [Altericroceibacterium endophyticum]|uniref:4,5-DOPA dioxygenase extradiol n=1 Tax=Altericroceibacterium endophyticum TaxID=1808508 RepID=A0A6I4T3X9_9SPHN|nr:4,5-DOPA dioxygenase extradiol [Altericroceibacterium endophyticum]MXO65009.1 4,5-DOPA dioxygenase extradiol [Altericroceibacterium endophyticum]
MSRMPIVFFGHGSPMVALEQSATTQSWKTIADRIGKPRAILCISAHWLTRMTAVTAMDNPRTIHDFGAFPQALFDVQYPAPGDPELALRVKDLLDPMPVALDQKWGLDHGTWSVLVHAFPDADIPVVQLGMDVNKSTAEHWQVGEMLRPLRDEGVLIMATGNIVHNLPAMDWGNPDAPPYDWAERFNNTMLDAVVDDRPQTVIDFAQLGEDARRSVPTPDHFWPLLYMLGARHPDEAVELEPNFIQHKSLGMTSILIGAQ